MEERLRALVAPFAVHGGRSDLARAQFGGEDWLDLSTGISPCAYPFVIADEALTRLPSPDDLALLEARAAACFGSDPARTVAVPGSDIGLRLIGHLLASARARVPVAHEALFRLGDDGQPSLLAEARTDADGRVRALLREALLPGSYQLVFDVAAYLGDEHDFFENMAIGFRIDDPKRSYHVPVLLSPFGLSTYRGS